MKDYELKTLVSKILDKKENKCNSNFVNSITTITKNEKPREKKRDVVMQSVKLSDYMDKCTECENLKNEVERLKKLLIANGISTDTKVTVFDSIESRLNALEKKVNRLEWESSCDKFEPDYDVYDKYDKFILNDEPKAILLNNAKAVYKPKMNF